MSLFSIIDPADCPDGPHRGPQGPNEDLGQCRKCGMPSHWPRPEGEEFGGHLPDCRLPRRHESYCESGGAGHPPAEKTRGYFPPPSPDAINAEQAEHLRRFYA